MPLMMTTTTMPLMMTATTMTMPALAMTVPALAMTVPALAMTVPALAMTVPRTVPTTRRLPPPLLRRLPAPTLSGRRHIQEDPSHALQPDDVQAARRVGRGPERCEATLLAGDAGRVCGGEGDVWIGRGLIGGIGERMLGGGR
ncbi:uncharacterized protein SCHCODRAFT_01038954 [Schizophyllum commune H4-8]|uniref:uncharacterized protein n=1 Tax=Schizophyllum commune (strain H4-8 / FGSC 9210) TaxID=578458 RepID=UPI00216062A4|nr:uncharacterized protein SCHCODRAFT_01038954 [Schizophyllum commune H4-8]KAI5888925.1 hypothetical protein SCHCODRAFT_01038954 [Schizophyllum commune H4-8]